MPDRLTPILDAIATKIAALAFTIDDVVLPVLVRKAAVRRLEMDPPAMITVSKSATPEEVTRFTFDEMRTDYVVDVVVHSIFVSVDADVSAFSTIRDTLVDAFSRPPIAGADDVFDVRARPADWLRPIGEGASEYDWQSLQITASVISPNPR